MIATITAQNKILKRKVGDVDIHLGHIKKSQRSGLGNYKSFFAGCDGNTNSCKTRRIPKLLVLFGLFIETACV